MENVILLSKVKMEGRKDGKIQFVVRRNSIMNTYLYSNYNLNALNVVSRCTYYYELGLVD